MSQEIKVKEELDYRNINSGMGTEKGRDFNFEYVKVLPLVYIEKFPDYCYL
jgi:hypothetical protein